jgi:hypothetical protein
VTLELLLAKNPDPDSKLPYLLRVPVDGGLVFRARDSWPRSAAIYCHPVPADEWNDELEVVGVVPLRSCSRRGSAIDIVADRSRENRSQIVYTTGRNRQMVFWQSPKTRKQSRPNTARPTGRASGLQQLHVVVDSNERYAYKFTQKPVETSKSRLPCGDYGVYGDEQLLAVVERKSVNDLSSSVLNGRLKFQMSDLAEQTRSAVVVENGYHELFKVSFGAPSAVADGLAELQVLYPNVPVVFCGSRPFAEEWTYRFLAAAYSWVHAPSPQNVGD